MHVVVGEQGVDQLAQVDAVSRALPRRHPTDPTPRRSHNEAQQQQQTKAKPAMLSASMQSMPIRKASFGFELEIY